MKFITLVAAAAALCLASSTLLAAEKAVTFVPAKPDPLVGDWKSERAGGHVAQVIVMPDGDYQANLLTAFDTNDKPLATLKGQRDGDTVKLRGSGWTAT